MSWPTLQVDQHNTILVSKEKRYFLPLAEWNIRHLLTRLQ